MQTQVFYGKTVINIFGTVEEFDSYIVLDYV